VFGRSKGVIIVDRGHIKEMFQAPDSQLNFVQAILEEADFNTALRANGHNDYHKYVVRNQLTQNIASILPEMMEELELAFQEELKVNNGN